MICANESLKVSIEEIAALGCHVEGELVVHIFHGAQEAALSACSLLLRFPLPRTRGEILRPTGLGLLLAWGEILSAARCRLLLTWRGLSLAGRSV
jgi:hypothetical protein